MGKLDDFLSHYASQYYDPAKAHEYYVNNRELKGRTTGGMSDAQKEAWGYTKQQITGEKNAKIEELRTQANAARAAIQAKLTKYANKQQSAAERNSIITALKTAIEGVKADYEKIYNTEYDNIRSKIAGKTPKPKKPKKGKAKSTSTVNWETFDKT